MNRKCSACEKNRPMYSTCHQCDMAMCVDCAESGRMIWIAVPWINDSGLPVSFCTVCIELVRKFIQDQREIKVKNPLYQSN